MAFLHRVRADALRFSLALVGAVIGSPARAPAVHLLSASTDLRRRLTPADCERLFNSVNLTPSWDALSRTICFPFAENRRRNFPRTILLSSTPRQRTGRGYPDGPDCSGIGRFPAPPASRVSNVPRQCRLASRSVGPTSRTYAANFTGPSPEATRLTTHRMAYCRPLRPLLPPLR